MALLDDDDLWAPDKLKRQLEAASAAEAGWVYAGVVEIDAEGRLLGGSAPPSPEELLAGLRRRNLMPAGSSNVAVRSDLLSASGGFDPRLRHLADWDLWLRLAALGPPACVPALVAYRLHHGQATLDTTGMLAEASTLEARHGRPHRHPSLGRMVTPADGTPPGGAARLCRRRARRRRHLPGPGGGGAAAPAPEHGAPSVATVGDRGGLDRGRATLARRLARTAAPASDTEAHG